WLLGEPGSWRWAFGVGAILAGFVAWESGGGRPRCRVPPAHW
ncbi:MAG: hypothetical protein JWQ36_1517, partial [Enterovirga sp.]|nr:hypothetical protein [Enterovirga sp.]